MKDKQQLHKDFIIYMNTNVYKYGGCSLDDEFTYNQLINPNSSDIHYFERLIFEYLIFIHSDCDMFVSHIQEEIRIGHHSWSVNDILDYIDSNI